MPEDLARAAAGLPVAALWPLTVPYLARKRFRATAVAALSAAYVLAPEIPSARSFVLLSLAALTALALANPVSEKGSEAEPDFTWQPAFAFLLASIAACAIDFDQAREATQSAMDSNDVALTVIGLFACVFLGGSLVAWLLHPFASKLEQERQEEEEEEEEEEGKTHAPALRMRADTSAGSSGPSCSLS